MPDARVPTIMGALDCIVPADAVDQVRFVTTDNASVGMHDALSKRYPNYEFMTLDPVHLVIVYKYSTWRRATQGSRMLSMIMGRFSSTIGIPSSESLGLPFKGRKPPPLTTPKATARDHILTHSFPERKAKDRAECCVSNDGEFCWISSLVKTKGEITGVSASAPHSQSKYGQ